MTGWDEDFDDLGNRFGLGGVGPKNLPGRPLPPEMPIFIERVRALVALIPLGQVATYGQIASLAGAPRRARMVGRAMATLPSGSKLPWHRVVNSQGRVSERGGTNPLKQNQKTPTPTSRQAKLLLAEGVVFQNGKISLRQFQWEPVPDENWPVIH